MKDREPIFTWLLVAGLVIAGAVIVGCSSLGLSEDHKALPITPG